VAMCEIGVWMITKLGKATLIATSSCFNILSVLENDWKLLFDLNRLERVCYELKLYPGKFLGWKQVIAFPSRSRMKNQYSVCCTYIVYIFFRYTAFCRCLYWRLVRGIDPRPAGSDSPMSFATGPLACPHI
jgi:hypothetical protein